MARFTANPATAEANSSVISAENLSAGYEGRSVWSGANFSFGKGEFVGVLGPNGAGKTTLFRVILGLQRPMAGSVQIFGAPPRRGNPHIGYVPQRHTVDTDTNVECLELVRLGLSGTWWGFNPIALHDREAALSALDAADAADLVHRRLGALSGGELQRVFLAEALVSNPDVLLLDEPLSNLDIRRETELLHLVNNVVRSRGVTALLIAHNINPLLPHMNKVMYIANGRMATGTPQKVLTSETLTQLYGVQVEVLKDPHGNVAIIGVEEHHGDVP
ncbi:MAG TPA: ATP-binding cassette domain-containing protein [Nitrososphaerales archaeon]|nr:ATP-binding cassette domain-containing protein [Nitrososphaerales archaeon]